MSRFYEMSLQISGFRKNRKSAIEQACSDEWDFREEDFFAGTRDQTLCLEVSSTGNLSGGEGEDEFASRIAKAIWKANGAFCPIVVDATYLEELPYERYSMGEQEYTKAMKTKQHPKGETACTTTTMNTNRVSPNGDAA